MKYTLPAIVVCLWTICCFAGEAMRSLPEPHYHPDDSDPRWLALSAQFHGHLGPWATAGTRLGMAGLKAAGAKGFFDVEVECRGPFVRPPKSCFLDGLQVATGATLGKRNLRWIKADKVAVCVENTQSGQAVEVRPTAKLLEWLGSVKPQSIGEHAHQTNKAGRTAAAAPDHPALERLARRIARAADHEILTITPLGDGLKRSTKNDGR